jgi:hypothetical protein
MSTLTNLTGLLRRSTSRLAVVGGICGTLVVAANVRPAGAQADGPPLPLHLTAFAVNMTGVGAATAGAVEITIERWSTTADHDRLVDVLVQKGPEQLLTALQDTEPRVGYINAPGQLGWALRYAQWQKGADGGYRVVFATDRPIGFWEARTNPRSRDYDFILCEIHMGGDGVGEGKLSNLAKVSYDAKQKRIEIEDYGIEPVRLTDVRVAGR